MQTEKEAKLEAKSVESENIIKEAEESFGILFITPFKIDSTKFYTAEETKTMNEKRKHHFKIMKKYLSESLKNAKDFLSRVKDDSVNDLVEYWGDLEK